MNPSGTLARAQLGCLGMWVSDARACTLAWLQGVHARCRSMQVMPSMQLCLKEELSEARY